MAKSVIRVIWNCPSKKWDSNNS